MCSYVSRGGLNYSHDHLFMNGHLGVVLHVKLLVTGADGKNQGSLGNNLGVVLLKRCL